MRVLFTTKILADGGPFLPTSFRDLLQKHILLPGLDPAWEHILVDVDVAADGSAALLAVSSTPPPATELTAPIRLVAGTPPAFIRVIDGQGSLLAEGRYASPLQPNQEVAVGEVHYVVASVSWPNRNPDTGICRGEVDWQQVVVGEPLPACPLGPTTAGSSSTGG